jgi:outer membrane protein assembly factor BamE (lipoprotein component of BamABCDE complex)
MGLSLISNVGNEKMKKSTTTIMVVIAILVFFICYAYFRSRFRQDETSPKDLTWQEYQLELASKKLRKGFSKETVILTIGNPDIEHDSEWIWRCPEHTNTWFYQLNVVFSNQVVSEFKIDWVCIVYLRDTE